VSSQQRPHKGGLLLGHLTDSAAVFAWPPHRECERQAKWVEMKANGTDHFSLPHSLK